MTISASLAARPITLDQLAALSDEIAALARAGVPLDRGLLELSHDMPGRLGQLAAELGERLQAGQPLDRAITDRLSASLPPVYQAVVAAGLRSGRLAAALEQIAHTARRISELRWSIGLSLVYPLIVLVVAWGLFMFVLQRILPVTAKAMVEFGVPGEQFARAVARIGSTAEIWGPVVPLFIVAYFAVVWVRSGFAPASIEIPGWFSFGALGTLRRLQRAGRLASLADFLGLLIANDVPLAEAVELASAAVGPQSLAAAGKVLAERLRRGEAIQAAPAGFPPLLAWTIASGQSREQLQRTLIRTAEIYRDELDRRSQWLALYVPLLLTSVICGSIVFGYAMLTLLPWILIMRRLALP